MHSSEPHLWDPIGHSLQELLTAVLYIRRRLRQGLCYGGRSTIVYGEGTQGRTEDVGAWRRGDNDLRGHPRTRWRCKHGVRYKRAELHGTGPGHRAERGQGEEDAKAASAANTAGDKKLTSAPVLGAGEKAVRWGLKHGRRERWLRGDYSSIISRPRETQCSRPSSTACSRFSCFWPNFGKAKL